MTNKQNNKINLVLASDQNYVKLLVPCIISILYNKKPTTEIDIYILESGISDYDKQKIKELESFNGVNNCTIIFIDITAKFPELFSTKTNHFYINNLTLARLTIPLLFGNLNKALYLDTDIIVKSDLLELYNQDLEDNYCCMTRTNPLHYTTVLYNDNHSINENYGLNAGVLIYNIQKIISDKKADELINIKKYTKRLPKYLDQDIIADTLKPKIKNMDISYNIGATDIDNFRKISGLQKKQYYKKIQEAKILHFVASIKPCHIKKLWKLTTTYYEFYKYYQISYLKINPIKLKFIFWWASIKRLRKLISGTRFEANGKKVFYFLWLEIVVRKSS